MDRGEDQNRITKLLVTLRDHFDFRTIANRIGLNLRFLV